MVKAHDIVKRPVSEDEFAGFVEGALTQFNWRWVHFEPVLMQGKGGRWIYRTPFRGYPNDGKGWLDYIAVRPPRLLVLEIKSSRGRLEPDQKAWLADLEACKEAGGMARLETYTWWPRDHELVLEVLR